MLVFHISDAGPKHLDVIYTTTLAHLPDVTHEKKGTVKSLIKKMIDDSLNQIDLPGGAEAIRRAKEKLNGQANARMNALMAARWNDKIWKVSTAILICIDE